MTKPLTAERLRELLHYDPETGVFTWKVRTSNRTAVGRAAGRPNKVLGYVYIGMNGATYLAHRLAWLYVHGEWPDDMLDHINGQRSDNRIVNLRAATNEVNAQNQRRARVPGKLLGAYRRKDGRYEAKIKTSGRNTWLGAFDSELEAHQRYVQAKRRLHEGCTI